MPRKHFQLLFAVISFCGSVLLMDGCGSLRYASSINVDFEDNVNGLQKGDQVYMLGLLIGETGKPIITDSHAIIPVMLRDKDVFDQDSQVLFLMIPDQSRPGRQCLVAQVHRVPPETGKPKFRGFTSTIKLNLEMQAEKIQSWWKHLNPN